jgi:hypothetical protein
MLTLAVRRDHRTVVCGAMANRDPFVQLAIAPVKSAKGINRKVLFVRCAISLEKLLRNRYVAP